MTVTSFVIAYIMVVCAIVSSIIIGVMVRFAEVEVIVVRISHIYSEAPFVSIGVDGAIEIVNVYEPAVLCVA